MHISKGSVAANDGCEYSYSSSEYPDMDLSMVCVSECPVTRVATINGSPISDLSDHRTDISIKSFPSQAEPTATAILITLVNVLRRLYVCSWRRC